MHIGKKTTWAVSDLALFGLLGGIFLWTQFNTPVQVLTNKSTKVSLPFASWSGVDGTSFFHTKLPKAEVFVAKEGITYILEERSPVARVESHLSYQQTMESRFSESTIVGKKEGVAIRESFGNSISPRGQVSSLATISHYLGNDEKAWRPGNTVFQSLALGEPWRGIAVELRAYPGNVEKLFRVSPGAAPQSISISVEGLERLSVESSGELLLETALGPVRMTKPIAYQEGHESRIPIEVAYTLLNERSYGFTIGNYDSSKELIIDPLIASTFIGGSQDERFAYDDFAGHVYTGHPSMVQDSNGDIYILGHSRSPNYPTSLGVFDSSYNDASSILKNDVVITKLSADLSTILASTYLGGTSEDNGASLALGHDGDIFVCGFTRSRDFPVTLTGFDTRYGGGNSDAFIAKISSDLSTLRISSYIGGAGSDFIYGLAVAPDRSLYLVGDTSSVRFPTRTGGYQVARSGENDAFVLQLTEDLSTVSSGTLLGGTSYDYGRMVALNSAGKVIVLGNTTSANFPTTTGAFDQTYNGETDGFVAILSADLSSLDSSTLLGGSAADSFNSMAINNTGSILLAGATNSVNFPTVAAGFDKSNNGMYDGVITKLSPNLANLEANSFLGGSRWEDIYELAVDGTDNVYFAGWTQSANLPVDAGSQDTTLGGASDAFVGKLSSDLSNKLALTYLGGSGNVDYVLSLGLNSSNNLLLYGFTDSPDFPTLNGAQNALSGGRDSFVALFTPEFINNTLPDHLVVRDNSNSSTATFTAGESNTIQIQVIDAAGHIATSYAGVHAVVLTGASTSAFGQLPTCSDNTGADIAFGNNTSITFTAGVASCVLKLYKAEVTSIDAAISASPTSSADSSYDLDLTVNITPASPLGSILSASPSPVLASNTVTLTVAVNDALGNQLGATAAGSSVALTVSGANPNTLTATHQGNGVFTASYVPTVAGEDLITGTLASVAITRDSDGASDGTFHLTVNPLPVDHYLVRYESAPKVYEAGASWEVDWSMPIVIIAVDQLGNVVTTDQSATGITLSGPSASPNGSAPYCYLPVNSACLFGVPIVLQFVNGETRLTAEFYKAENFALDVTDGIHSSFADPNYDLDLEVSARSPKHYEVTGSPTQTPGTSQLISIAARDELGNISMGFSGDIALTFSGAGMSGSGSMPTATDNANNPINFGAGTTLTFVSGIATSLLTLYRSEIAAIDVTDGSRSSFDNVGWDLDVTVSSLGTVSALQSSISTNANPTGLCGPLGITVSARDSQGNLLTDAAGTVVITVSGANPGAPVVTNRNNGTYVAQYTPSATGIDQITASYNGTPVGRDTDGLANDGVFQQTIDGSAGSTVTWEGDISADWYLAANWVENVVPTICSDVIIDGASPSPPTLDLSANAVKVKSVSIGPTTSSVLTLANASQENLLHITEDLTIGGFGNLTHAANGLTRVHSLYVQVDGDLSIAASGTIDVSAKGYDYTTGDRGSGPGGGILTSNGAGGGSHGGRGGGMADYRWETSLSYDSIPQPIDLGSAGANCYTCEGGGAIRLIVSGNLQNAGEIKADGAALGGLGGGGAGGSIWIDVAGALNGAGKISARGANSTNDGSGGGGRVAVYFGTNNFSGEVSAFDGNLFSGGSASCGTVYLKAASSSYGDLILNTFDYNSRPKTTDIRETVAVQNLSLVNGSVLNVTEGGDLTMFASGISCPSTHGELYIQNNSTFNAPNFTNQTDDLWVSRYGNFNGPSATLTINTGVWWSEYGENLQIGNTQPVHNIIVQGALTFHNMTEVLQATFDSITVKNGGALSAGNVGYLVVPTLNFKVNQLIVESGSYFGNRWSGYGYADGPGVGLAGGGHYSGSGHGGKGGADGPNSGGAAYGSITQPIARGSGGVGNLSYDLYGGAAIRIEARDLITIDGELSNWSERRGSSGSIWLTTDTFSGSGSIEDTGGAGDGGGGGGGRIAIYYATKTYSGTISSYGGVGSGVGQTGGAGTIFLKDAANSYGDLIIDNKGFYGATTPLNENLTVNNLSVRNGAILEIPSPYTLTVLANSIDTTTNSSLFIAEGGTFNAPSLTSLVNWQVINHGTFNYSSSTLMIGSGLTWYEDGARKAIGDSNPITDLVVQGNLIFGNQTSGSQTDFNTITVQSGGRISATKLPNSPNSARGDLLVAAFGFDENSGGMVNDQSASRNIGTISNATWTSAGRFGSALDFNGSDSIVTVPSQPDLNLTSEMTLEAWVYPTASEVPPQLKVIFIKWGAYAIDLFGDYCGVDYVEASGGHPSTQALLPLALNTWSHIAATLDGTQLRLFVNGTLAAETAANSTIRTTNSPLEIGGTIVGEVNEFFQGKIDEVRIYRRALSVAEIQQDMISPIADTSNLSHAYTLAGDPAPLNLSANTVTIEPGGAIDLDGAGYNYASGNQGAGPGGGEGDGADGQGGGHGGNGGRDANYGLSLHYGSITQPTDYGSAGGSCPGLCPGGGALKLTVTGTLDVQGAIRAGGLSSSIQGGGGAGGSIIIDAQTMTGNGLVSANGASSGNHGGGGGGRMFIHYLTNNFTGSLQAYGGVSSSAVWGRNGGPGSIYIKSGGIPDSPLTPPMAGDDSGGRLVFDNGGNFGESYIDENLTLTGLAIVRGASSGIWPGNTVTLLGTDFIIDANSTFGLGNSSFVGTSLSSLSNCGGINLWPGAVFELASAVRLDNCYVYFEGEADWRNLDNLTIGANSRLRLSKFSLARSLSLKELVIENLGRLEHAENDDIQRNILNVSADNVTLETGGFIDVTGQGFSADQGPGKATGDSGGGYGGKGGDGATGLGGANYGSMAVPLNLGSGGGSGGSGGGVVIVQAADTIALDGEIHADGGSAGANGGGGSGGSVLLSAKTLSGSGLITASGGNGAGSGGGGGGGRVAIYVFSQSYIADGGSITQPGLIINPVGGIGLNPVADGSLYFSYADHYQVTGGATQVSGTSQIIDLQIIDNYGLPFYWNFTRSVVFSGPGQANINGTLLSPSWTDRDGNPVVLGQPTVLDFTDGATSSSMTLYKVELVSVDTTDGTIDSFANPTYDLDVAVTAQEATLELGSDINAVPSVVEVNHSVSVTVLVKDQWGNVKTTGGDAVTLKVVGANSQALPVTDNLNGAYSAAYVPTSPGVDQITGTLNTKNITGDLDGLSDGTYYVTVTAGVANHLEITGPAGMIAGAGYQVTLKAVSASGAVDAAYSGDKQITLSGARPGPLGHLPTCRNVLGQDVPLGSPTTLEFILGEATCQMRLYRVGATEIDATDGSIDSTGNGLWDLNTTVNNVLADGLTGRISAMPNPVERNFAVTINVATFDTYGNALASGGQAITLQVTGANTITPAVTDLGDGTYSATYTPTVGGLDLITGTIAGFVINADTDGASDGVFNETVTATITPTHLEVTGVNSQEAGSAQTITITVRDDAGDTAFTYSGDKAITLSGPLPAPTGTQPTCTDKSGADIALGLPTTLSFINGQANCSLKLYRLEVTSVDATDGTLSSAADSSWDLDIVVSGKINGSIDGTLGAGPDPSDRGGQVTVEVEANDEYGNDLPDGSVVNALVSGGNDTALVLAKVSPRRYRGVYVATNAGEDLITADVAGRALVKDSDGVSDGVYHLTVREKIQPKHKISGKVYWREPAGEPVKGVLVSDGTRSVPSNGNGTYELTDLDDGSYTISGLYEGYEVRVQAGLNPVNVSGGEVRDIDLVVWREAPLRLYASWNGFLDNVVINEVFNTGSEELKVTIDLYKMEGSRVGRGSKTSIVVKPREEVDIIINDLNGFEADRYGVLVLEMSHGSYNGQVSYYKLAPSGSFRKSEKLTEDFDYAFANPFVAPIKGTSWVTFNTHQPSRRLEERGYLVPNWLTIINGESQASQYFRIRKYNEAGERIEIPDNTGTVSQVCQAQNNELRCRVSALGRIDIDGGHVYPGPEHVGLVEIAPESNEGNYVAGIARYGVNSPPEIYSNRYSFGAYLQARKGQGREQVLSVSSAGGAENWVEVANTLASSVGAQIEVVGYNGEVLYTRSLSLKAHAQEHINVGEILGVNASGVLRLTADKPESVLAQGASYYLSATSQLLGVSLIQYQDTFGRKLYGTYNRYLNAYNWLKVINLAHTKRTVTLVIHRGASDDSYILSVPGSGGYDLPLHDTARFGIEPDTIGMFELQDSLAGSLSAELLRIKPGPDNGLDFSMSSRLR